MLAPACLPNVRIVAFLLEHAPQIVIRTAAELKILSIIILWSLLDNVFWIQLMLNVIINTMGQAKPDS